MAVLTEAACAPPASAAAGGVVVPGEPKAGGRPNEEGPPDRGASNNDSALPSALLACLVWPLICALPLTLTAGQDSAGYRSFFPTSWYDEAPVAPELNAYGVADPRTIKPLGLTLGLLAVAVGQVFTVLYHALRRGGWLGVTRRVQTKDRAYDFYEGLTTHLAQPEGFAMIGGYLIGTWMLGWMPSSYYSFGGGISWFNVAAQLLLQDFFQYIMHLGEHKVSAWIYKHSHKEHHRHTNPRLFDAFDGSVADTSLMILVPFLLVKRVVAANVWDYMTFGTLYANWLVLIHSEMVHPWDWLFRRLGWGTAADHNVHHRLFVFNYGHLFMYWDKIFGTYKDARNVGGTFFNKDM